MLAVLALTTLHALSSAGDRSASVPDVPLGAHVEHLPFSDTRWLARDLADFGDKQAIVVVFTSLDCPIAARVFPRLVELEKALRPRGVQFVAIDVGPTDDMIEVAARAVEQGCEFPVGRDYDGAAQRALAATRTPEIAVLDAKRTLVYRGRFDGSERYAGSVPTSVRADLAEALDDVLAGKPVRVASTPLEGCKITPPSAREPESAVKPPQWAGEIAPLFSKHCASCHVEGGMAPFALTTAAQCAAKAGMIAEVVEQGRMPPWFASRRFGSFENERGLAPEERERILDWALAGAPGGAGGEGVRAEAEHQPTSGWYIGEPDLVLTVLAETKLPATGYVPYRYLMLPKLFTSETWVEAVEIRPANPRVVHHANLGWYQLGSDFKAQNFITGQVPGGDPMILPDGIAYRIPAGAMLGLQVHYVTTGREETDRISVGFRFARRKIQQQLKHFEIADFRFEIAPFAPAFPVHAKKTFPEDALGVGCFVHMHLRGRDMKFVAHPPQGEPETLLFVPNYSFDWQMAYKWRFGQQKFAKGTSVECLAHFDNSKFNPFNPDPTKAVRFGQETYDEMMYGFLFYVDEHERLELSVDPKTGIALAR